MAAGTCWYASVFNAASGYCTCRHEGGEEISVLKMNLTIDSIQQRLAIEERKTVDTYDSEWCLIIESDELTLGILLESRY